jgi:hypothetical protein
VIQRCLHYALTQGIVGGSPEQAARALRRLDPVLARISQTRLRRLLSQARATTTVSDPRHVMRVATFLLHARVPQANYDSVDELRVEFADVFRVPRTPRYGPWLTGALAVVSLLSVLGLLVFRWLLEPFDPRETDAGKVLVLVPRFVAKASENASHRDIDRAYVEAKSERTLLSFGKRGADALRAVVEATDAVRRAKSLDRETQNHFINRVVDFDQALKAAHISYYLDGEIIGAGERMVPVLLSFYAEREATVEAEGRQIDVLYLWRLDSLNLRQPYVGYTRPYAPAAMVLLDQIEMDLVRDVLPALPPGQAMVLVDDETAVLDDGWVAELGARAAQIARTHYLRSRLLPDAHLARVAELLALRRKLFRKWRANVTNLGLAPPARLIPERDYASALALEVPAGELERWDAINKELLFPTNLAAFLRARDAYAQSIERHEVQHRLDYERGLIPVPAVLAARLGIQNTLDAPTDTLEGRARDELSAYLASIAQAPVSPLLDLLLLARFVFDGGMRGGPYSYAALAGYEGIGRELGIDVDDVLGKGVVTQARFANLVYAVCGHDPNRIRDAASRFYKAAYGQELATVRESGNVFHTPWRH